MASAERKRLFPQKMKPVSLVLVLILLLGALVLSVVSTRAAIETDTRIRAMEISVNTVNWWFYFSGIAAMGYYVLLGLTRGWRVPGMLLWPLLSCALLFRAVVVHLIQALEGPFPMSPWLYFTLHSLQALLFIGFAVIIISILRCSGRSCPDDIDCLLVLGCMSDSPVLYARADAAADYLLAHGDCLVICTGGQGGNESVSEAESAARRLRSAGVETDRIRLEDRSRNTIQNLVNSVPLVPDSAMKLALVTDDYHQFRARLLARHYLKKPVSGLPVHTSSMTLPHYVMKEFFSCLLLLLKRFTGRNR